MPVLTIQNTCVSKLLLLAVQLRAARPLNKEDMVLAFTRNALCRGRTLEQHDALDSVSKDPEWVIQ